MPASSLTFCLIASARYPATDYDADGAEDATDTKSFGSIKEEEKKKSNLVNSREEATNRVIANMIRQLASLSEHAHGVFGKN